MLVAVYGGSLYTDEVYEVIRGGRYAALYLRGAVAIVILAGRLGVFLCAVLQLE